MAMTFTVDPCEGCGQTKHQSTPPQTVWVRQDPPMPNVSLHVCKDCEKRVAAHNKPYEDAEREADRQAKAVMDAKLAEQAKAEEAKANREQNVLDAVLQQNQLIIALLSKMAGVEAPAPAFVPPVVQPEPAPPPPPPPAPEPPKPAVPGLDQLIGKPSNEKPKRRSRRTG